MRAYKRSGGREGGREGGGGELVLGRAYKRTKNAFQKKLHNNAN